MNKVSLYAFIVKSNDLRHEYFIYIKNGKHLHFLCSKVNPQNINMNKKQKHNLHFIKPRHK